MPGEGFYKGLSSAEAVRKLAEHHAAPATRHLSFYEYQLLMEVAYHLDPLAEGVQEWPLKQSDWQALEQVYSTSVSRREAQSGLDVFSVPRRILRHPFEVDYLAVGSPDVSPARVIPASAVAAEAAIATLLVSKRTRQTRFSSVIQQFDHFQAHPAAMESELLPDEYWLVNRILYQPSVPVEQSPPSFASLENVIAGAASTVVGMANLHHLGLVAVAEVGLTIVVLKTSTAVGDRLSDVIRGVGRGKDPSGQSGPERSQKQPSHKRRDRRAK